MNKFTKLISENNNIRQKYSDIIAEIKDYIVKTTNDDSDEKVKEFIAEYLAKPDGTIIEGLVNDSDVYDFYLKYTSDIDDMLSSNNHFDLSPKELGVFSLYGYVVLSTRESIKEFIKLI